MSYADNILDAVDILIDKKIANLPYDKTVRATITAIVDESLLKYKVKYQNAFLYAYAIDSDQRYEVDDEIYLQIPSNDFNKNPLIIGKVLKTPVSPRQVMTINERAIKYAHNLMVTNNLLLTYTVPEAMAEIDFDSYLPIDDYDNFWLSFDVESTTRVAGDEIRILAPDGTILDTAVYSNGLNGTLNHTSIIAKITEGPLIFQLVPKAENSAYNITNLQFYPIRDVLMHEGEYQGITLDIGFIADTRDGLGNGEIALQGYLKEDGFTISKFTAFDWYVRDDSNASGWTNLTSATIGDWWSNATVRCLATYNGVTYEAELEIPPIIRQFYLTAPETTFDFSTIGDNFIITAHAPSESGNIAYYWSYYDSNKSNREVYTNNSATYNVVTLTPSAQWAIFACTIKQNNTIKGQAEILLTNAQEGLVLRGGTKDNYTISYDATGKLINPAQIEVSVLYIQNNTEADVSYHWTTTCPLITIENPNSRSTLLTVSPQWKQNSNNTVVTVSAGGQTLNIAIEVTKPGGDTSVVAIDQKELKFKDLPEEIFYRNHSYYKTHNGSTAITVVEPYWIDTPNVSLPSVPLPNDPAMRVMTTVPFGEYTYTESIATQVVSSTTFYIQGGYRRAVYSIEGILTEYDTTPFTVQGGTNVTVWQANWEDESYTGLSYEVEPPYYFDPTKTYTLTATNGTLSATIYMNFYMDRSVYITDDTWNGITSCGNRSDGSPEIYFPAWSVMGNEEEQGAQASHAAAGLVQTADGLQANLVLEDVLINGATNLPDDWKIHQAQIDDRNLKPVSVVTTSRTPTLNATANNQTKTFYIHLTTQDIWAPTTQGGTAQKISVVTGVTINTTAGNEGSFNFTINTNTYSLTPNNDTKTTIYPFNINS